MKKVFLFASAAIAALAMVSCNKEIETPESLAGEVCPDGYYIEELEVTYPVDPATRTAFNETSGKFAWTEGDELAFHLSNGTYTSAPIDPATSKVKLYLPVGVTRDNYAVYPASAVVEDAATVGNMQVTLPSTYDISGNLTTEFVPMPLIATNDAENKNLKFEHVGGLLQVNLNVPAGVKTATLSMGKTITGTFDLAAGSGNGVIEAGAISDDALTFVLSEDGLTADFTEVKLLAPLPSGVYDKFEVAYDNGYAFTKDLSSSPWSFGRTQGKKVSIAEDNFEDATNYFWFEALEAGSTIDLRAGTHNYPDEVVMYYSTDNKKTWTRAPLDFPVITLENVGDRVYLYNDGPWSSSTTPPIYRFSNDNSSYEDYVNYFVATGRVAVGGDIMTLVSKDGKGTMCDYCFKSLFKNMTALEDASELVLPDSNLSVDCFRKMFYKCTSLTKAPKLPAQELATGCYYSMFHGCTSLVNAPELPATTLDSKCYFNMFYGCTSLIDAPELPAVDMAVSCYAYMFAECTNLLNAPALRSMNLANGCYNYMFYRCRSLVNAPALPATELADNCYAYMFYDCRKLAACPELKATVMKERAYQYLISDCAALVTPPELPAMELAEYCYDHMFYYCSNLTSIPELRAIVMKPHCYESMFASCSVLEGDIILPATTLSESCYYRMFQVCKKITSCEIMAETIPDSRCLSAMFTNCSLLSKVTVHFTEWNMSSTNTDAWFGSKNASSGEFYKPQSLPIEYGYYRIPSGWTVYNLEEVGAGI